MQVVATASVVASNVVASTSFSIAVILSLYSTKVSIASAGLLRMPRMQQVVFASFRIAFLLSSIASPGQGSSADISPSLGGSGPARPGRD
jgi:hypothetical protein